MPAEHKHALSLRALSREYGIDRSFLSGLVHSGQLPALRRGRRIVVLRADFELWFRRHAISTTAHAERVVQERIEREEQKST
jgi:hypothetical protein